MGRRARLEVILERDGPTCVWCRRPVGHGLVEATTEHVVPRAKGGPSWLENEVAACHRCNARRGHLSPTDWADRCEQQGWEPDRERLVRVLRALQDRIASEGMLEPSAVRRAWADHLEGRRDHKEALWTVLMFQAWLEACRSWSGAATGSRG